MTKLVYATLAYQRDDESYHILATFNNVDECLPQPFFEKHVLQQVKLLAATTGEDVLIFERQDAPDYFDLGESEDEDALTLQLWNQHQ
ncbi:MAG: hypothetical protein HC843_04655 [Sphingomonadales bacterium]|nr:hypothetical protein [Sphingomonadales bacterium]